MPHRTGPALAATALTAALALSAVPSVAGTAPVAGSAALHNCKMTIRQEQQLGATYVVKLQVSHVTCATGKKVVRAFHHCRKAHGGLKGRCPHSVSVLGYHCTDKQTRNAREINGVGNCTRGTRRVRNYYTQIF